MVIILGIHIVGATLKMNIWSQCCCMLSLLHVIILMSNRQIYWSTTTGAYLDFFFDPFLFRDQYSSSLESVLVWLGLPLL